MNNQAAKGVACTVPPAGWRCTRDAGHDGPCAAVEVKPFQMFAGWTPEQIAAWVESKGEPTGCEACGAVAGACPSFPNCYGNPSWTPPKRRMRRAFWELEFQWKRLRVCLLSAWYLRHWPWNDISTSEWRFLLDGLSARNAFLEGWCRE